MSDQIPDLPTLYPGKHDEHEGRACIMEYVSVITGEEWSDAPKCVHPLLATAARSVNDTAGDADRTYLLSLIEELVGTSEVTYYGLSEGGLYYDLANAMSHWTIDVGSHYTVRREVLQGLMSASQSFGMGLSARNRHPSAAEEREEMEGYFATAVGLFAAVATRAGVQEEFMTYLLGRFAEATTVVEVEEDRSSWLHPAEGQMVYLTLHTSSGAQVGKAVPGTLLTPLTFTVESGSLSAVTS